MVVQIALVTINLKLTVDSSLALAWLLRAIIAIATFFLVAFARPYKRNYMNILESLMLAFIGLVSLVILNCIPVATCYLHRHSCYCHI